MHARLEPAGDGQTRVIVDTDLKVTGRPAQFGRGVLQDVGGRIIEQFATCLATRMAAPAAEPAAAGRSGTEEPPAEPAGADVPPEPRAAGDAPRPLARHACRSRPRRRPGRPCSRPTRTRRPSSTSARSSCRR